MILDAETERLNELVLVGPLREALRMQVLAQTVGELHVGGEVSAVDGLMHEASRHRARCIVGKDRALALGNRRDGEEQIARGLESTRS